MKKRLLVALLMATLVYVFAGCEAEEILGDAGLKKDVGVKDTGGGQCTPNCEGKACGDDDGCGGRCDGSCPPGQTCNTNTYTCEGGQTCTDGAKQCNGNVVQTCTGGTWVNGEDCAASGKTCQNGACVGGGVCTDGQKQCSGDKVQVCTGGNWVDSEDCAASGKTCQNGACVGGGVCTDGQRQCSGDKVQVCTGGNWVDSEDCAASGKVCQNGVCIASGSCVSKEGGDCNINNNPCCEGLACVTIAKDQEDSKCYKDCTNDQTVCSSTQQCIGWAVGQAACFETTTIANGTFSNCKSYADGEEPGKTDQPGSASIKFTLGGISYNFTACFGDFQYIDQEGNYWVIQIVDTSKLQTKLIAYLYNIIVDETEHTVGQHEIGEKIQPVIYELVLDKQYNTTKAVLHGFGIDGTLNFTTVGTGQKKPTSGTISNVLMMGYDYVLCDNNAGKPCQ